MISRQSPRNQTLYADLLQEVVSDAMPSGTGLSFSRKTIKGRGYWYLTVAIGRSRIQTYLGPDGEALRARIEAQRERWAQGSAERCERTKLVQHLARSGAVATPPTQGKVLSLLADSGVFLAGGVMVGSVAFAAYANMLGVNWAAGNLQTQDIDIAGDHVHVAVDRNGVKLQQVLEESQMGFRPVPPLNPRDPETSFTLGRGRIHVDLLTPMLGRTAHKPVEIERLGVYAEPVRFLDFLLADTQQAVLLARSGILVNVPSPARYALHKLVVSERRQASWATKVRKDVAQAAQLIEVLLEDMPGALIEAYAAARDYHAKFHQQLRAGAGRLPSEVRSALGDALGIRLTERR